MLGEGSNNAGLLKSFNLRDQQLKIITHIERLIYMYLMVTRNQKPIIDALPTPPKQRGMNSKITIKIVKSITSKIKSQGKRTKEKKGTKKNYKNN